MTQKDCHSRGNGNPGGEAGVLRTYTLGSLVMHSEQNVAMADEGGGTVAHRSDFYKISLLGRRLGGVARST